MKKKIILFLLLCLLLSSNVYSQVVPLLTLDALVAGIIQNSVIEDIIFYGQTAQHYIETVQYFFDQAERWGEQVIHFSKVLRSAEDIESFDDFMEFYNKALQAEQQMNRMFSNLSISIGGNTYSWDNINTLGEQLNDDLIGFWDREMTEEERKNMWLNLGLTPSNYAYVKPYRDLANLVSNELFVSPDVQASMSQRTHERINDRLNMLANAEDDDMGQVEIAQYQLESSLYMESVLDNIARELALQSQFMSLHYRLDNAPGNQTNVTDISAPNAYKPLVPENNPRTFDAGMPHYRF